MKFNMGLGLGSVNLGESLCIHVESLLIEVVIIQTPPCSSMSFFLADGTLWFLSQGLGTSGWTMWPVRGRRTACSNAAFPAGGKQTVDMPRMQEWHARHCDKRGLATKDYLLRRELLDPRDCSRPAAIFLPFQVLAKWSSISQGLL